MIRVNEYMEGRVKSPGAEFQGEFFTAGVILPGQYDFSTEKEEHILITLGALSIQLPGAEWKKAGKGETLTVPRGVEFQLKADHTVSDLCFYK